MPRPRSNNSVTPQRRWTPADAQTVLSALKASGLSANAFATRNGFDVNRLYKWRQRMEKSEASPQVPTFIEVPHSASRAQLVEVVLLCGRTLRVPASFDALTLRHLVDTLDAPC